MSLPDAAEELAVAQKAVRLARRAFGATNSVFVKTMRTVMDAYLTARSQGVQRDDAIKGIEFSLRDVWPKPTTKFAPACAVCDDVGLEERICRLYQRCERAFCERRGEEWEHRYGVACSCVQGARFRPHVREGSSLEQAGKVGKRKRGWAKVGE